MSRHTPGPWKLELTKRGNKTLFAVTAKLGCEWIVDGDVKLSTDVPNLNLIAAAPELLEALEELVADLEKRHPMSVTNKALTAIAKAKGGA